MTRPIRAEDGAVEGWVTESEPEWSDEDRAWAIALLQLDADKCGGCGQWLSETTAPDAEGSYEADLPTRCHACTPLAKRQAEYPGEQQAGLMFTVERRGHGH